MNVKTGPPHQAERTGFAVCQNDGTVELWGHCVQCQKCNILTTKSDMARHVRTFVAHGNYETSPPFFNNQ